MSRHDISDEHWQRIEALVCPRRTSLQGRPAKDPRLIFNGILWILRTGSPWRDLLQDFGPWQTVYKRFNAWAKSPILHNVLNVLAKDADLESIISPLRKRHFDSGIIGCVKDQNDKFIVADHKNERQKAKRVTVDHY
ncbi:transposase [Desulfonatronum parangueonense]